MKKFGLIQPGRIGDIIILLPAMKYLHDKGYHVIWPIFEEYVWMFTEVVDYVTFVPIKNDVYAAVNTCNHILKNIYKVDEIVDTAATFPGSTATEEYVKSGDGLGENFDAFKYRLLNIPIDEKWNLSIKRNVEKEEELFNKLVKNNKYAIACLTCSQGRYNIDLDAGDGQIIEVTNDYNMFHWIKLLEKASSIVVLNSGFFCLVEQLNLPNKKTVFRIPNPKFPVLRNKWNVV